MLKKKEILQHGDLVVNPLEQTVCYHGQEIFFTNREFQILYLLLEYKGYVLNKKQIYEQVTNDDKSVDYHTIEITISRIRKKLESISGKKDFIITIREGGYKFRR